MPSIADLMRQVIRLDQAGDAPAILKTSQDIMEKLADHLNRPNQEKGRPHPPVTPTLDHLAKHLQESGAHGIEAGVPILTRIAIDGHVPPRQTGVLPPRRPHRL